MLLQNYTQVHLTIFQDKSWRVRYMVADKFTEVKSRCLILLLKGLTCVGWTYYIYCSLGLHIPTDQRASKQPF